MSRIASLRKEILEFRQDEKESIGGLSKESALQLDVTAGESFMHKTTSEAEALLDRILENTSFTEALPLEEPSSHEEAPLIESAILTLNHLDSTSAFTRIKNNGG